jgi:hypothetical protein
VAALVINVVAAVSSGDVPLNAVQVLSLSLSFPVCVCVCVCVVLADVFRTFLYLCFLISVAFFTASLGESYHGYSGSTSLGY